MARNALCIGLNYAGSAHALAGCLNDVEDWTALFRANGFATATLTEADATRAGLVAAIEALVTQLLPGELGAIQYSGHGTWLPDTAGDEVDTRDEALVPWDAGPDGTNLLLDDDIAVIFGKLAPGAHLLYVTDSCHSGTVYRAAPAPASAPVRMRFLPPANYLVDPTMVARMDRAFGRLASIAAAPPLPGVIHFSACRDPQYAADANFQNRANGAFSYYAVPAFREAAAHGGLYYDVWKDLRRFLPSFAFQQNPQLNASADLKQAPALV